MNFSIVSKVARISLSILSSIIFLAESVSIWEYFLRAKSIYFGLPILAGKLCR